MDYSRIVNARGVTAGWVRADGGIIKDSYTVGWVDIAGEVRRDGRYVGRIHNNGDIRSNDGYVGHVRADGQILAGRDGRHAGWAVPETGSTVNIRHHGGAGFLVLLSHAGKYDTVQFLSGRFSRPGNQIPFYDKKNQLALVFKQLRKHAKITRAELSRRLNVDRKFIRYIEERRFSHLPEEFITSVSNEFQRCGLSSADISFLEFAKHEIHSSERFDRMENLLHSLIEMRTHETIEIKNPSPESSPVRRRKPCESCGGKGYIEVRGQKQKCTTCNGSGEVTAA